MSEMAAYRSLLTVEKREEEMQVGNGAAAMRYNRRGFFLPPTAGQSNGDQSPPPLLDPARVFPNRSDVAVRFPGWKSPPREWKLWTEAMYSVHHEAWTHAGICEAIHNSCATIVPCNGLILGFVEKWNPGTNTFVFPWGEATVTLEDVAVLGGYLVLGRPVFSSAADGSQEMIAAVEQLKAARKYLNCSPSSKVAQSMWKGLFFNSGSEVEHEAFLAMWLSRFVFPKPSQADTVDFRVLDLAVLLARGVRIALGPAVLASVYASLSELKGYLVRGDFERKLSVSAPLQLLQVWIWERFSALGPYPLVSRVNPGQPWFSRWDGVREFTIPSAVRAVLDRAGGDFIWRPYYRVAESRVYGDEPRIVSIGSDETVEMLIRFLRCAELVGIDAGCIQLYLPHRVAMQLGYDQDVPGLVSRADSSRAAAWEDYSRVVTHSQLHVVPRLHEAGVSSRYSRWWYRSVASSSQAGLLHVPLLEELEASSSHIKEEPAE